MFRKPKLVLLCCLPLAIPLLMAGYGATLMEWQSSRREAVRTGSVEAVRGVERSQDYVWHSGAFQRAANELIATGRCTEADFDSQGGFVRIQGERHRYMIRCPSDGGDPMTVLVTSSGGHRLGG